MKIEKNFTVKKEDGSDKNIGTRIYNLTNKEIIAFLKTRMGQVAINARSTTVRTSRGYPVLSRAIIEHLDPAKDYSNEISYTTIHCTEKYMQTHSKADIENEKSTCKLEQLISGFIAKKLMNVKDTEVEIVIGNSDYDRYAELISMFKDINENILQSVIAIDFIKTDKVSYYVLKFPDKKGLPSMVYFFRNNRSLLVFDEKGFNIIANSDIQSISDLIAG